jgi:hypothetical protein
LLSRRRDQYLRRNDSEAQDQHTDHTMLEKAIHSASNYRRQ